VPGSRKAGVLLAHAGLGQEHLDVLLRGEPRCGRKKYSDRLMRSALRKYHNRMIESSQVIADDASRDGEGYAGGDEAA